MNGSENVTIFEVSQYPTDPIHKIIVPNRASI